MLRELFVFFFKFYIGFHGFHVKKLKIIQHDFLTGGAEKNLVAKNKDNKVFMSRKYRSDSCPLEI